jgi:hypothetical protein
MYEVPEGGREVMKLIKISTDLKLTVHDFPSGNHSQQNEVLRKLIGDDCNLYEHVLPMHLYTTLHMKERPTNVPGQCVCMLIDEEGRLKKKLASNVVGSYLYETDKHNNPIMGNILFVGEEWGGDGIDFCGIEEAVFNTLKHQLDNIILAMKATMEVMSK